MAKRCEPTIASNCEATRLRSKEEAKKEVLAKVHALCKMGKAFELFCDEFCIIEWEEAFVDANDVNDFLSLFKEFSDKMVGLTSRLGAVYSVQTAELSDRLPTNDVN